MVTAGEVVRAKEKAVGGKRDRCRKGKNCSATCISGWKACLVEMAAPLSESLGKVKRVIQRKSEQILPGKRGKYLEGRKEKFIKARDKVIQRIKRADLRGDREKGAELRGRLGKLEGTVGTKLKVPTVGEVSTKVTEARRAKYNGFKSSLVDELKRLATENKKGSYDKIEERLMRLQSKAGGKFGDKDMIKKGGIWREMENKRLSNRLQKSDKALRTILSSLENAAKAGDADRYRKIEDALLKAYRGGVAKKHNLSLERGSVWRKMAPEGSKGDLEVKKTGGVSKPKVKVKPDKVTNSPPKSEDGDLKRFLSSHDQSRKTPPKLERIETTDDFNRKKVETEGAYNSNIKMYNSWLTRVLKPAVEYMGTFEDSPTGNFFKALFQSVEAGMGGRKQLNDAIFNVENFTGGSYREIRNAQMGRGGTKERKDEANSIEKLLSRKELIRPPVEKFRGVTVDTDTLNAMIASVKAGGTYSGRALSSWSTDLGVGQFFADSGPARPEKVIYRTVNVHGVPVSGISQAKSESELLTTGRANYRYLRHTVIKAIDKNGEESTYNLIDVEEY